MDDFFYKYIIDKKLDITKISINHFGINKNYNKSIQDSIERDEKYSNFSMIPTLFENKEGLKNLNKDKYIAEVNNNNLLLSEEYFNSNNKEDSLKNVIPMSIDPFQFACFGGDNLGK